MALACEVVLSLIIPDVHAPFHCRHSTGHLLKTAERHSKDISRVVLLGDVADLHALSTHRRDPAWEDNLDKELAATRRWLENLRRVLPKAEIDYIKGNHEDRWDRYVQGRTPAMRLIGVTYPRFVGLDELGIRWVDCEERRKGVPVPCGQGKRVECWHGHEFSGHSKLPAGHAMKIAIQTGNNTHIGHTHRWGQVTTVSGGKTLFAMEGGYLGQSKSAGFKYAGPKPKWWTAYHIYDSEATDSPLGIAFTPKKT